MPPIINYLKDKRVAILGFGKEGKSTYSYIRRYLPKQPLTIADQQPIHDSLTYVDLVIGEDYQKLNGYDVIMKSPGIVMHETYAPGVLDSQTNLFLKYYGKQTIGITGTKGKSTTASLLYHIIKENQRKCVLLGNIGKPAFDALDQLDEDTIVVYELSCHQLEYAHYAPHYGVLLNIFEEHLDHYGSFARYVAAKEQIWRNQSETDHLIIEKSLIKSEIAAQCISASMQDEASDLYAQENSVSLMGEHFVIDAAATALLGHHNRYDIAIDLYLAHCLGIAYQDALAALVTFAPLAHRLQYIGEYHGITWYDDSISTVCETTIQALQGLKHVDTLLLGGMDRGIDYTPLTSYLNEHPIANIIVMYESGETLAKQLRVPYTKVKDLETAVTLAKRITKPKGIVLLSPAAASYGHFRNFEDRGDQFQQLLKQSVK